MLNYNRQNVEAGKPMTKNMRRKMAKKFTIPTRHLRGNWSSGYDGIGITKNVDSGGRSNGSRLTNPNGRKEDVEALMANKHKGKHPVSANGNEIWNDAE